MAVQFFKNAAVGTPAEIRHAVPPNDEPIQLVKDTRTSLRY
jgi:hypothetical protein